MRNTTRSVLVALCCWLPLPAAAQEASPEPAAATREAEVVRARVVAAPGHRSVREVRQLIAGGGRVDWSQQGDWIAFDQADSTGLYDIYITNLDTGSEKCLTCEVYDFRKVNALSPAWHPSGDYLVFQVQEHASRLKLDALRLTTSHRGLHSDLWIITRDGKAAWRLTSIREQGGAVVDPHFSHEAGKLVWTQRVVSNRTWGEWEPQVAEFRFKRGVPRLGKVRSIEPPLQKGFVLAHGFTPNDRGLLLSGVPDPGQAWAGRDILELDLETLEIKRLTSTSGLWDGQVFSLPRSDGVVWVSDRNIPRLKNGKLPRRGDVWYMSADGRRRERLTFFNDPKSDSFLGEALIDDMSWSPQGDQLLLHVVSAGAGSGVVEGIYLVELEGF